MLIQTKFMNIINLLIKSLTLQLLFMGFLTLKAQKNLPEGRTLEPANQIKIEQNTLPEIPNFDGTYQIILKSERSVFLHSEILKELREAEKMMKTIFLFWRRIAKCIYPQKIKFSQKHLVHL